MATVLVIFTATYTVKSAGGPTYQKGSVRSMAEASARHYFNRGVARLANPGDIQAASAIPTAAEPQVPPVPPNPTSTTAIDGTTDRTLTCDVDLRGIMDEVRRAEGVEAPAAMGTSSVDDAPDPGLPALQPEVPAAPEQPKPDARMKVPWRPLVSCVMPTWNRARFIPAAIDCWLKQTYENKELVIVDDGDEPIRNLIPKTKEIRYIRLKKKLSTGVKRNKCCELAKGEVVCHWDDDDWSAPNRIEEQVHALESLGKPVTGYATLYFWDQRRNQARRFQSGVAGYVCGTSLCYLKSFWADHKFPDKQMSSDNAFVYPNVKSISASHDATMMVARIHDCHHTSPKDGVGREVNKDLLPHGFWENEALITLEAEK